MAMGRAEGGQDELTATWAEMPRSPGHAFCDRLQEEQRESGFDAFVEEVGRVRYRFARRLVITAAGGGSNRSRVRLGRLELQRLADELAISIEVHHLPPRTSNWNKIEHRLFSFIAQNWRATPLVSHRVIVEP